MLSAFFVKLSSTPKLTTIFKPVFIGDIFTFSGAILQNHFELMITLFKVMIEWLNCPWVCMLVNHSLDIELDLI